KILLHAIVGDKNVRKTVAIIIGERNPKSSSLLGREACARADVFKRAIAAISVQKTRGCWKNIRRAIGMPVSTTNFVVIGVPLHVAGYEQIKIAIVVVIKEACGNGPAAACNTCFAGYIGEGAIAIVVIENILAIAGDEQIG